MIAAVWAAVAFAYIDPSQLAEQDIVAGWDSAALVHVLALVA